MADIAKALLDFQLVQRRIAIAVERDHFMAGANELSADCLAEEATTARYQYLHARNCNDLRLLKAARATFPRMSHIVRLLAILILLPAAVHAERVVTGTPPSGASC